MKNMIQFKCCLIFLFLFPMALNGYAAQQNPVKQVAVLPFETNAPKDLSYVSQGVLNMLHTRLAWKNNVEIISSSTIAGLGPENDFTSKTRIPGIAGQLNADYVIYGIITEFSNAFSVDTKVYNAKEHTILTFFDQSETIDDLTSKVDILDAKINKKIFDRTTLSYEKFKKEKIITEEELRRMNPERLMPEIRPVEKTDKPWWKIW